MSAHDADGATAWKRIAGWPVLRQLTGDDRLGLCEAAKSARSAGLEARTETADRVVPSICPYCAVGCGQRIYVKDEQVIQVEGDPDSPVSRGRLCPKGSATKQLVTGPAPTERRPQTGDAEHRRTLGFASLGGATLDNEENYLMKKLYTALGAIQVENQARI